jgi:CBS-domain-containing membrane protein
MQWTRSTHPPAGATALAAVIGGDAVTALGWSFVLKPVLLNAILLLIAGLVFNWPRKSHRYPVRAADTANRDNP